MRGRDDSSGSLFSYIDLEDRVPAKHPLRIIGGIVNEVLEALSGDIEAMYSSTGRPGGPAGEASTGVAVASLLYDSLGTPVDGAA